MIQGTRRLLRVIALTTIAGLALLALMPGQAALAQEDGAAAGVLEAAEDATTPRPIVPYQPRMRTGDDDAPQERETVLELLWPEYLGADTAAMIFGGATIEAGGYYGGGATNAGNVNARQNNPRAAGIGQGGAGRGLGQGPRDGSARGRGMQQGGVRGGNPTLNAFGTTYR